MVEAVLVGVKCPGAKEYRQTPETEKAVSRFFSRAP